MERNSPTYQTYCNILKEELIPAMGCTEPISIAYAASYVRDLLGGEPDRMEIEASGNLIKNVKSVVVPNTGGLRGIPAAAAAGVVAGQTQKVLEVISQVSPEQKERIRTYLKERDITVSLKETDFTLDFLMTAYRGTQWAQVRIANYHTNLVFVRRNDEILLDCPVSCSQDTTQAEYDTLNLTDILDFAETARLEDLSECIDQQISCNLAIAREGLHGEYGTATGKTLLERFGDSNVEIRMRAFAAAASEARMNGCEMPVVIVSGSGNQGITASVPVAVYAQANGMTREQLIRATAVSDLLTIYQKSFIGRLSAFCGAVSAGAAAAAGVCFLNGGREKEIADTLTNALATDAGIVCDGAKSSCAAKISAILEASLQGWHMAKAGRVFSVGDGLVGESAAVTIANMGELARKGMRETDHKILEIMTKE